MTTPIAVTGATGRMGRTVLAAASERDDVAVALAVSESAAGQRIEGTSIEPADELPELLAERDLAVLIDFTAPEASVEYVAAAAEAGVGSVVGTTGFDDDQRDALRTAAEAVPVLHAANFARGIAALGAAVERAVRELPGYDVEVTETHHAGKRDAPSGTALRLVERIEAAGEFGSEAAGDGRNDEDDGERDHRVHGREGEQPREDGEIGIHARRAGDVRGEHEVLLAGGDEVLRITHRSGSRRPFAEGALDAATELAGRDRGWYRLSDVNCDS